MPPGRAERGTRATALHPPHLELEIPDLVGMLDLRNAALQSGHSLYANDDLVWRAVLLLGQGRDRLRQASPAQSLPRAGGRMELLAVPRSRSGHEVLRLAETAEPGLRPECAAP